MPHQLTMSKRHVRVDTPHLLNLALVSKILTIASPDLTHEVQAELLLLPVDSTVAAVERLGEMAAILDYWPKRVLNVIAENGTDVAWHMLLEPTHWRTPSAEVIRYVERMLEDRSRFPTVDEIRTAFNRKPTSRRPSAAVGQLDFDA